MTGIERLRGHARRMDELHVWPGGARLREIADQIEREHDAEVADSPYDAILPEDREAAAWVREHGGLDHVMAEWRSRVPYDKHERGRQRLLDHIAECETALGRRNGRIEELGQRIGDLTAENAELRRRAMLEGIEWPRFEDGEQVKIGDMVELNTMVAKVCGVFISKYGYVLHGESGENTGSNARFDYPNFGRAKRPKQDHIGADGLHIHDDETVYLVDGNGEPLYVIGTKADGYQTVFVRNQSGYVNNYDAQRLTHTKPEPPDSAERIAEDIKRMAEEWCSHPTLREASEKAASSVGEATMGVALSNLSKRCRALAERERCE